MMGGGGPVRNSGQAACEKYLSSGGLVVQMLTVADDSTLRERERNGLCQWPVNNLYKPITTRITETSEPRPATSLLRNAVMHEDDKNMFAATQSKGKKRR